MHFSQWFRLQLLAIQIRQVDEELGEAFKQAVQKNRPEDWARVHDRLNMVGEFEHADRIREIYAARK